MGLVLLTLGILTVYLFIGYVVIRFLDDEGLMDSDEILGICIVFFPIVLIGVGIREGGDKLIEYIQNIREK